MDANRRDPCLLEYPFERCVDVEPPAEYHRLREEDPVTLVRMPSGDLAYLVTRYDDVRLVLSDPRFSVDSSRPGAPRPVMMPRDDSMMAKDPPEHTRLRNLVAHAFTPRRVERLRPRIQEIIHGLLDAMAAAGPPSDLNEALARPLPVTVICELLGVPPADRSVLRQLTDSMVSLTAHTPEQMRLSRAALRDYLGELAQVKRDHPADDMLSALVAARDEQDALSASEVVSQALLLLIAGYETTANQIGIGVVSLLRHPGCTDALRADPDLVEPAVEELLRHDPPGDSGQLRIAVEDVELSGVQVPSGSAVLAVIPSANRDWRFIVDPDCLDLARGSARHLTFGHGAHFCLGAALARVELRTAFDSLLRRFPDLRLAVPIGELRWRPGLRLSGFASVPVTW